MSATQNTSQSNRSPQDSSESMSVKFKEDSESQQRKPTVPITNLLKALIPACLLLIITFWVNSSHLWGLFYRQGGHVKTAKVAVVDFDGGIFGEPLMQAVGMYDQTYGNPTYVQLDPQTSSPEDVTHCVFTGEYWAAIYIQPGSTDRFDAAINGTSPSYDPSQIYTYVLMPARYYTMYVSTIQTMVLTAVNTAISIFSSQTVGPILVSSSFSNTTTAASALAYPIRATEVSAAPQSLNNLDDKPFLNTVGCVFLILIQFFFMMALNGIGNGLHFYAANDVKTHSLIRLVISIVWPLITSLCSTGWTFAFRGTYKLDAKMFFAYWAVSWVFSIINFDFVDILTGFLPMGFVPLVFFTWVIFNVASALGPETLLNNWYRVSYFFPSLHWYQTVITILSEGGVNKLHYTLPTLAGWLVVLKVISPLATKSRIRKATETYQYFASKDALDAPRH